MNWFYADNGQQRGPVSEAEFDALVAAGSIQPATLVWREGMEKWLPLAEVRPVGSVSGGPPPASNASPEGSAPTSASLVVGSLVCSVCGKMFSEDQIIRFGPTIVCAGCKPVFLQRLREGAPTAAAGTSAGTLSSAELLASDYSADIGGDLGRSWEIFKADAGTIIGASILVFLCMAAGGAIPFLGIILQLVLTGPLMGGLWNFYAKKARGEQATIGDAFAGFGPKFLPLFLVQLVPLILSFVFVAIFFAGFLGVMIPGAAAGNSGAGRAMAGVGLTVAIVVGGLFYLLMIFLQICWSFSVPLVIDKGMDFWPALELSRKMVMKHFWWTLLLMIVFGLVVFAGALVCLIGMIVTGPWAFGAVAQHYNRVFGRLRQGG